PPNPAKITDSRASKYIDIALFKKIGSFESAVTETKKELLISVELPQELVNTDSSVNRVYKVVRIHNGEAAILDTAYDASTNKLTFKTDKFSTYAIVYSDSIIRNPGGDSGAADTGSTGGSSGVTDTGSTDNLGSTSETDSAKTRDNSPIGWLLVLAALSGIAFVAGLKKKSQSIM
ncbi:MAG: hypothetical protein Q4F11_03190, partial [Eubacteriales bacterium]|nr:hypothetical protein [Eubacteriales bacterium]